MGGAQRDADVRRSLEALDAIGTADVLSSGTHDDQFGRAWTITLHTIKGAALQVFGGPHWSWCDRYRVLRRRCLRPVQWSHLHCGQSAGR